MKTLRLQTYGDLAENIKYTIASHLSYASRVYIIFDVYKKNSIKDAERSAHRSVGEIPISIKKTSKRYQWIYRCFGIVWSTKYKFKGTSD